MKQSIVLPSDGMAAPLSHVPDAEHTFFLYSPEGSGLTFWRTAEERDEYAKKEIRTYVDDTWHEGVEGVFAGVVTSLSRECNVQKPEGKIDDEGYDEAGEWWPETDCECKCDYALTPIAP